jgi:Fe-S-cluster containining protein
VLFGDVELQRGDDAPKLATLGLELFKKGRKQAFNQPCACFDGKLCGIYPNRPGRCRSFECRQIQLLETGALSLASAERNVRATGRLAAEVLRLLRALGNADEAKPLNQRYAAVMAQPMDLGGDEAQLELRGELMLAVGRLVDALGRDFLTASDREPGRCG